MTSTKTTDIGAGGIVDAGEFAIVAEKVDGRTTTYPRRWSDFDSAQRRADRINDEIARGINFWDVQAYVVTADGSAV